jgi:DHA1 family quinolone resistance protein-like MFS transporter
MSFSRKMLTFLCYYNLFILGVYLSMYQISLLRIAGYYSLDAVMAGFIVAVQYFGMFLPPLLIGTLSGRFGKKKILYVSYAFLVVGTFLVFAAESFALFCIALATVGAGFTVLEATTSAALSDEFPQKSRFHISMSQAVFSIGALIGPFLSEWLFRSGLTFKELFLGAGVLFLLGGIASVFTEHTKAEGDACRKQPLYTSFRYFRTLPFIFLGLALFLYTGIEEITGFYADSYYKLVAGDLGAGALALSLYWGMMIPSRLLGGILKLKTRTILAFCSALLALSLAGSMAAPHIRWKVFLFALAGFASGPIWPMLMDSVAARYAGSTGPVMTIMMSLCCLGGGALPFLTGLIVKITDYSFAYYFAAAAACGIFLAYLGSLKKRTQGKRNVKTSGC